MQTPVAHPGEEFVLCLNGRITYHIAAQAYDLDVGDSLLFKAIQPHCWENHTNELATVLIVFQSAQDHPLLWRRHSF